MIPKSNGPFFFISHYLKKCENIYMLVSALHCFTSFFKTHLFFFLNVQLWNREAIKNQYKILVVFIEYDVNYFTQIDSTLSRYQHCVQENQMDPFLSLYPSVCVLFGLHSISAAPISWNNLSKWLSFKTIPGKIGKQCIRLLLCSLTQWHCILIRARVLKSCNTHSNTIFGLLSCALYN